VILAGRQRRGLRARPHPAGHAGGISKSLAFPRHQSRDDAAMEPGWHCDNHRTRRPPLGSGLPPLSSAPPAVLDPISSRGRRWIEHKSREFIGRGLGFESICTIRTPFDFLKQEINHRNPSRRAPVRSVLGQPILATTARRREGSDRAPWRPRNPWPDRLRAGGL